MQTHTPGPWEVMPDSWLDHHVDISASRWGALAAVVVIVDDKPSEQGQANARLIAAAPALLAALVALSTNPHIALDDMIYRVREVEGEGWDGPAVVAWGKAVEDAKTAIALATGAAS